MNFPDLSAMSARRDAGGSTMPDVQGSTDHRNLPIDQVGVRGVRYPVLIAREGGGVAASVGEFSLSVALPAAQKGTHMSRFIELLEETNQKGMALSAKGMQALLQDMLKRLSASAGMIQVDMPFFMMKTAPVSGVQSMMDYKLRWVAQASGAADGKADAVDEIWCQVKVPVKSLCPCSKEISDYGAHNQRSEVTVQIQCAGGAEITAEQLIRTIEAQASCELWGLLKRPDEKYVTERAYDNPKFVEDLVRDVAVSVRSLPGVKRFMVEAENFESIHNHSAWARIVS
jgi:GTP cyclohydrolase IB